MKFAQRNKNVNKNFTSCEIIRNKMSIKSNVRKFEQFNRCAYVIDFESDLSRLVFANSR